MVALPVDVVVSVVSVVAVVPVVVLPVAVVASEAAEVVAVAADSRAEAVGAALAEASVVGEAMLNRRYCLLTAFGGFGSFLQEYFLSSCAS